MEQRISEQWLSGLKGPERDEMKSLVLQNTILLDKLSKIVYNMKEGSEKAVLADYDTPSWSHKQAHLNGQADVIRKLLDLLKVTEREDHSQKV